MSGPDDRRDDLQEYPTPGEIARGDDTARPAGGRGREGERGQ